MKKKYLYVLLYFTFCMTLVACKNNEEPYTKEYINYMLQEEPASLDPQVAYDYSSRILIMNMFEGLARIDHNGQIIPAAAESWEANQDFTVFTFRIKKDACWSNEEKTPLRAADFVFAFKRALSLDTDSKTKSSLYAIKNASQIARNEKPVSTLGAYAKDEKTLVIELEYPYKDFPEITALSVAMPCNEQFFYECQGQYGLECASTLCNGPYKFPNRYSWEHGKSISLTRNLNYHSLDKAIPQGMNFSIDSESSNTLGALYDSKIDAMPIKDLDSLETSQFDLTSFEDTVWGLCFNIEDPIFGNLNVRSGFLKCLDKNSILEPLKDPYIKADDIIIPGITVAGENYRQLAESNLSLKYSSDASEQLQTGLQQTNQSSIPVVNVYCLDNTTMRSVVSNILEAWNNNFDLYFNMTAMSLEDLNDKVLSSDYQIAVLPITAKNNSPADILSLFNSSSLANPAKLKDPAYDNIIDNILQSSGKSSVPYCIQAEKYLNDNAIFYPLCFQKHYFASSKNVQGIIFHPYFNGIDFSQAKKVSAN